MFYNISDWKQHYFLQDVCHCVLQLVAQPITRFPYILYFFTEEVIGFKIQSFFSVVIYK